MGYFVFMCEGRLRDVGMQKFHGASNDDGLCICTDDGEAELVFKGRTCVESVTSALVPGFSVASIVVDDYFATHGAKWCEILIKGSMELLP